MRKLILLKRQNPTEYEIHRGSISQALNLVLTTKDKEFAEDLVHGYNQHVENVRIRTEGFCICTKECLGCFHKDAKCKKLKGYNK